MKKIVSSTLTLFILIFALSSIAVAETNLALNATVGLTGSFFTNGWGLGMIVSQDTIVDGIFLPQSNQWDQGAVWWDSNFLPTGAYPDPQFITIDLGGIYSISSFIVQADDNDAYILSYWDSLGSSWKVAWNIPAVGGWGMQTRPNKLDNTEKYSLLTPISTNMLKFEGTGDGQYTDFYFSVSEIQAFGPQPVPEPATLLLLGSGLLGLVGLRRKFKA